jgi:hypothetical protein
MSDTYRRIIDLVQRGDLIVSEHGYDELAMDGLFVNDLVRGVREASIVEDYPLYPKGPCVLVRQWGRDREPVHVVWGIPRDAQSAAVLVTAYRPDKERWTDDFMRRKP